MHDPKEQSLDTPSLPFYFHQFGIQYTNRCDYRCAHCGTESGGHQPTWNLGIDFVTPLFPILQDFGFQEVTITGGECLLFEDEINSLISHAKSVGLKTKIISNGSWAQNLANAHRMLERLIENGLDTLTISYDRFHQPFGGSLFQLKRLFEANRSLSHMVRFQIYTLEASPNDNKQKSIIAHLRELVAPGDLFLQRVIPVGRARFLPASLFTEVPRDQLDKPCYQVFSPFLDHQKRLYRCCSGYELGERSPLFLGFVDSAKSLALQLGRLKDDLLHKALASLGPPLIFSEAFHNRSGLTTLCHFCIAEMRNQNAPEQIRSFLDANDYLVRSVYNKTGQALRV